MGLAMFVCHPLPPAVFLPYWPFFMASVEFLISRFQNVKNTKLYCIFGKNAGVCKQESICPSSQSQVGLPARALGIPTGLTAHTPPALPPLPQAPGNTSIQKEAVARESGGR